MATALVYCSLRNYFSARRHISYESCICNFMWQYFKFSSLFVVLSYKIFPNNGNVVLS